MYSLFSALEHKHNEERKILIDQWGSEKDQLLHQNILLNEKLQHVQNYENEIQSELLKTQKVIFIQINKIYYINLLKCNSF